MALLWALFGLVVAPFLNLAIDRLPELNDAPATTDGEAGSICHARRPRSALLATLLGLVNRRGVYPRRSALLVELATGIAFGLLFLHFGFGPRLMMYSLYSSILIVIFLIDWRHRRILNRVTYPAFILSILLTSTLTPIGLGMALAGAAAGGSLLGLVYVAGLMAFRKEVLGLGDVKLGFLLGAMAGFPSVVWWLFLGSLFGAIGGLMLLVSRRSALHDFMPYGTAMCLGAFVSLFMDFSPLL